MTGDQINQYEFIVKVKSLQHIELQDSIVGRQNVIIMGECKLQHVNSHFGVNNERYNEEKSPPRPRYKSLVQIPLKTDGVSYFYAEMSESAHSLSWKIPALHSRGSDSSQLLDNAQRLTDCVKGSIKFYIFFNSDCAPDLLGDTFNTEDATGWGLLDLKCLYEGTISDNDECKLISNQHVKLYGCGIKCNMIISLSQHKSPGKSFIDDKYSVNKNEVNLYDVGPSSCHFIRSNLFLNNTDDNNAREPSPLPLPPPSNYDDSLIHKNISKSTHDVFQIGQGKECFLATICIRNAFNLHLLDVLCPTIADKNGAWLSYSCFGMIIQSERFFSMKYPSFTPLKDAFSIRMSANEISQLPPLFVHVCVNGEIVGSAGIPLGSLEQSTVKQRTVLRGNFSFNREVGQLSDHVDSGAYEPYICIEIILEGEFIDSITTTSTNNSAHNQSMNKHGISIQSTAPKEKANSTIKEFTKGQEYDLRGQHIPKNGEMVPKQHQDWEQWRQRQELEWNQKLREKEIAAMRHLEEKAKEKDKELSRVINNFHLEYGRLEQRLKKALAEVELKERTLTSDDIKRKTDYDQKVVDLQIQQRRVKDEANHIAEREKAKTQLNLERISFLEKNVSKAEERRRLVEHELEELQQRYRNSTESALMHDIVILKAKISDNEALIMRERSDKNKALIDREKYKAKVHQLSRALQREKNKKEAEIRQGAQNLRLEYLAQEQMFRLDGDKDMLRTIKEELRSLNSNSRIQPKIVSTNPFKPEMHPSPIANQQDEFPRRHTPSPLTSA